MLQNFDGTEAMGGRIHEPSPSVPFSLDDELASSLASFLENQATLQESERHFTVKVRDDDCIEFGGHVDPIIFDCLAEVRNVHWKRIDAEVAQFRAEAEMLETESVSALDDTQLGCFYDEVYDATQPDAPESMEKWRALCTRKKKD